MDEKIKKELKKQYQKNGDKVDELITSIENFEVESNIDYLSKSSDKIREIMQKNNAHFTNKEEKLEQIQELTNQLYNIKPADVLIDVQVIINQYRNKYDITDPREIIHYDNGKGFVQ